MPDSNFMDLQLRDLHLLQVMLSEGSLTRAASLLDTTQPTLSKALARLRLHLGDPLLVRDGQIMRPTPKGAAMLTSLRNFLSSAKGLVYPGSLPFDPQLSNHRFRLLVSDVGMILFLPAMTTRLAAVGPGLKLEALSLDSRNFEAKLASGEADLALGAYAKAPRDLRRQQLYTDGYTSIARYDHPKRQRLARLGEFRAAQHVLVTASETGHTAHQIAQQSIEAAIPPERVLLRLPSFIAAALVAAESDGIGHHTNQSCRTAQAPAETADVSATGLNAADHGRAILARTISPRHQPPLAAAVLFRIVCPSGIDLPSLRFIRSVQSGPLEVRIAA
jgi:DNA-binding transcriptional LysR family regulator